MPSLTLAIRVPSEVLEQIDLICQRTEHTRSYVGRRLVEEGLKGETFGSAVKAKRRQRYVLEQLAAHGFVPRSAILPALEAPIVLGPRPPPPAGVGYVEEVRRRLVLHYGEKAVLEGGLRIELALDPTLQAEAERAVRRGLEALDRRRGYRGGPVVVWGTVVWGIVVEAKGTAGDRSGSRLSTRRLPAIGAPCSTSSARTSTTGSWSS